MIKIDKNLIMIHFISFCSFFILTAWIIQSASAANNVIGSVHEERCTLTRIDGPVVKTSNKVFTLGEEIRITDITGRSILIYQIPLPCEARLVYQCISNEECSSIKSIEVLQKIKDIPK
jgi:hypothetical protein